MTQRPSSSVRSSRIVVVVAGLLIGVAVSVGVTVTFRNGEGDASFRGPSLSFETVGSVTLPPRGPNLYESPTNKLAWWAVAPDLVESRSRAALRDERRQSWSVVGIDDQHAIVVFEFDGRCSDQAAVEQSWSEHELVLTLYTGFDPGPNFVCPYIEGAAVVVELEQPLAGRTVIDGTSGLAARPQPGPN